MLTKYTLKELSTKLIQIISWIFDYTGFTKPRLAIQVLHNIEGKLSQCNVVIFSLNVGREGDCLIKMEADSITDEVHYSILSLDPFLQIFFYHLQFFGNVSI